jgi:thiol-disulfide isomerase/thioredoxin
VIFQSVSGRHRFRVWMSFLEEVIMGRTNLGWITGAVLGAGLIFCLPDVGAAKEENSNPLPRVQLVTLEGDTLSLTEVCEGKTSFIYLWATWCKTCKKDMKHVFKLREKFGEKVQVFGIAWKNSAEEIQTYFAGRKESLHSYIDTDGRVFEAFETRLTPTVVIVDGRGEVLFFGYASFGKFRKLLDQALKG